MSSLSTSGSNGSINHHPDLLDIEPLKDPEAPPATHGMDHELFLRTAAELGRRLSIRQTKDDLVQKNIMKDGESDHAPGPISNRLSVDKEKAASTLNKRLSLRPTAMDLKLRNILKMDSMDNVANPNLQKNVDFQAAQKTVKSCLKKRPEKNDLEEMNIVKAGEFNVAPALAAKQTELRHSQLKDMLDSKLRDRPNVEDLKERKIIMFQETVEVYPTFKKNEYNRKPDEDATFRKLTPQMKVQIREELNSFKRTEMEVHESSANNTCFH